MTKNYPVLNCNDEENILKINRIVKCSVIGLKSVENGTHLEPFLDQSASVVVCTDRS